MEIGKIFKAKRLAKELSETKKLLEREKQKNETEMQERQELEIRLWKTEGEVRKYQYRETHIRDVLKYDYWKRLSLLYTMDEKDLKNIVHLDNIFAEPGRKTWGVVECYCMQCGKILKARYFKNEKEALMYLAVKQALGIAPDFDTCMDCYQESIKECA